MNCIKIYGKRGSRGYSVVGFVIGCVLVLCLFVLVVGLNGLFV